MMGKDSVMSAHLFVNFVYYQQMQACLSNKAQP